MGGIFSGQSKALSTGDLLNHLHSQFSTWNQTVENLQKNTTCMNEFEMRTYLHNLMTETEKDLSNINKSYQVWLNEAELRQHPYQYAQQQRRQQHQQGQQKQQSYPKPQQQVNRNQNTRSAALSLPIQQSQRDWEKTVRDLKQENRKMDEQVRRTKETLEYANANKMQARIKELERNCHTFEKRCIEYQEKWALDNGKMEKDLQRLKQEKEAVLTRLSKVASRQLVHDNPNITDLSDPNRPTKIGEMYRELYDNQWTDAFDGLTEAGKTERETIDILLWTVKDAVDFCQHRASKLMTVLGEMMMNFSSATTVEEHQEMFGYEQWRKQESPEKFTSNVIKEDTTVQTSEISEMQQRHKLGVTMVPIPNLEYEGQTFRKELAPVLMPVLQMVYLQPRWDVDCITKMKPYIKECLKIGWYMAVQTPPMVLRHLPTRGDNFDKDMYQSYTVIGAVIDFTVWPAMMLSAKTPNLIAKGVVQGQKRSPSPETACCADPRDV